MKAFFKNPIHIVIAIFVIIVLFAGIQIVKQVKNGNYHSVNY